MARKKKTAPTAQQLVEVHGKFHPRHAMETKHVEILPVTETPIAPSAPSASLQAAIENMVRKRVDEILSASGIGELDPHFRPQEVAQKARQIQDMFERKKWSLYFEKWGCQVCGRKTVSHMNTGHCQTCAVRIHSRLKQIKLDYERAHPEAEIERQIDQLTLRTRSAERLLRGEREE